MLPGTLIAKMSRRAVGTANRTRAIASHMMSTAAADEVPVLFESNLSVRTYILNRPKKLNALDEPMLNILKPKIEGWNKSELCGAIVGTGAGRAFCAGGDVASVVLNAANDSTRHKAIDFFKREFEMDYLLASIKKPYVAVLDGFTMGGGVGLAAHAPFRIATENTVFAMPETKIGYCPDVGASHFLSRLDGELGTYLGLTSDTLKGRAVFELGFATHYIPSRRVPMLLARLAELEDAPRFGSINAAIEDLASEREPEEPAPPFILEHRKALDLAFSQNTVEEIIQTLDLIRSSYDDPISTWAQDTIATLRLRSPTSLKVALEAIRRGKKMPLKDCLNMELKIATAYCRGASRDFAEGVKAVLVDKLPPDVRPNWQPETLKGVHDDIVSRFFDPESIWLVDAPEIETGPSQLDEKTLDRLTKYGLPTEEEIGEVVRGGHPSNGGSALSLPDLLAHFHDIRNGKIGVKDKVLEVVQRRCDLVDNRDGNFIWLQWKH